MKRRYIIYKSETAPTANEDKYIWVNDSEYRVYDGINTWVDITAPTGKLDESVIPDTFIKRSEVTSVSVDTVDSVLENTDTFTELQSTVNNLKTQLSSTNSNLSSLSSSVDTKISGIRDTYATKSDLNNSANNLTNSLMQTINSSVSSATSSLESQLSNKLGADDLSKTATIQSIQSRLDTKLTKSELNTELEKTTTISSMKSDIDKRLTKESSTIKGIEAALIATVENAASKTNSGSSTSGGSGSSGTITYIALDENNDLTVISDDYATVNTDDSGNQTIGGKKVIGGVPLTLSVDDLPADDTVTP